MVAELLPSFRRISHAAVTAAMSCPQTGDGAGANAARTNRTDRRPETENESSVEMEKVNRLKVSRKLLFESLSIKDL